MVHGFLIVAAFLGAEPWIFFGPGIEPISDAFLTTGPPGKPPSQPLSSVSPEVSPLPLPYWPALPSSGTFVICNMTIYPCYQ